MHRILIVDDQRVERDGIRYLIREYGLPLAITEKANGAEALEDLVDHPVDILLTDIKMPFMDGLTLAKKARELQPDLVIILFSAYGEFEYAKRAIDSKVEHYLLKPIDLAEFRDVMIDAVLECKEKKEKIVIDHVLGARSNGWMQNRLEQSSVYRNIRYSLMILVAFKSKVFDTNMETFEEGMYETFGSRFLHVNLNEYESIIFLQTDTDDSEDTSGEAIKRLLAERFSQPCCIVIGGRIECPEDLQAIYLQMERTLGNYFHFDSHVVLRTGRSLMPDNVGVNKCLVQLYQSIHTNRYEEAKTRLNLLFQHLGEAQSLSAIYVKFLCSEIVKTFFERNGEVELPSFYRVIESLYEANDLLQLKVILEELLDNHHTPNDNKTEERGSIAIEQIFAVIHEEYAMDIGLEYIAEKVYMSPGYLSFLFKKETGQNMMKYITQYRLKKAAELLIHSNRKVIDIGRSIGYTNLSYFCNVFKNYYEVTPSQYRESRGVRETDYPESEKSEV